MGTGLLTGAVVVGVLVIVLDVIVWARTKHWSLLAQEAAKQSAKSCEDAYEAVDAVEAALAAVLNKPEEVD